MKSEKFNTKYKIGDKLLCIRSYIFRGDIFFIKNKTYPIKDIHYSQFNSSYDYTTNYRPFYLVENETSEVSSWNQLIFSSNENFNEKSYGVSGGSGMSAHGNIDEYFVGLKESRKLKLKEIAKF